MEQVEGVLKEQGLSPRPRWLQDCMHSLLQSCPTFPHLPLGKQVELCFSMFLYSDMNLSSTGTLTQDIRQLHKAVLEGRFIFQSILSSFKAAVGLLGSPGLWNDKPLSTVHFLLSGSKIMIDEVIDIGAGAKDRYAEKNASTTRCLKLSLTDGSQRLFAIEYRATSALQVFTPAGTKIAVTDANVRRGLLLLAPENVDVLGGSVERLEVARKKAVARWNQPPSGRRTMHGVPGPSVVEAAIGAAWADDAQPLPADNRAAVGDPQVATNRTDFQQRDASHWGQAGDPNGHGQQREQAPMSEPQASGAAAQQRPAQHSHQGWENNTTYSVASGGTSAAASQLSHQSWQPPMHRNPSGVAQGVSECGSREVPIEFDNDGPSEDGTVGDDSFTYLVKFQNQLQHPSPLPIRWPLRGRIKCMVMGVKQFDFKERDTFYLSVHIEDGSSISEATVMHQIVQAIVGCGPRDVMEKLSCSDVLQVAGIKNALRQLQTLFAKFEGLVDLEFSDPKSTPQIVGMSEGVTLPEAYSLLKRLHTTTTTSAPPPPARTYKQAETIDLSTP